MDNQKDTKPDSLTSSRLTEIIEDAVHWQGRVASLVISSLIIFAGEEPGAPVDRKNQLEIPEFPESYKALFKGADNDRHFRASKGRLDNLARDLKSAAHALNISDGPQAQEKTFQTFQACFEAFVATLFRVEQDYLLIDHGIDTVTNLRSARVVWTDLEKEMERRTREGKPFTLVLAVLDRAVEHSSASPETSTQSDLQMAAKALQSGMRTYDDAYRLDDTSFLICLKQSDLTGGNRYAGRVRDSLAGQEHHGDGVGTKEPLSLSFCIGEPFPGESLKRFIANMYEDLENEKSDRASIVFYDDSAPIERLVRQI